MQTTTAGRPAAATEFTTKVKGKWHLNETKIELPKLPAGMQQPKDFKMPGAQVSLKNMESGDTWTVINGKATKLDTTSSEVMRAMAGTKVAGPLAGALFKNTGKKEKVGDYETEVWESVTEDTTIVAWVAPSLLHIKEAMMSVKPKEGSVEAQAWSAYSPLPGFVVKESISTDMGKMLAKSIPAGAKVPAHLSNMKSVSIREVVEVKELNFSAAEFVLPEGVQ